MASKVLTYTAGGWDDSSYVYNDDSNYAWAINYHGWGPTAYLHANIVAGQIPTDSIITGIYVRVDKRANGDQVIDYGVQFKISGSLVGDDKSKDTDWWPTSFQTFYYGAEDDTWGIDSETLTNALLNGTLQFNIRCWDMDTWIDLGRNLYIEYIKIEVFYGWAIEDVYGPAIQVI
jgi:hypothetical protein